MLHNELLKRSRVGLVCKYSKYVLHSELLKRSRVGLVCKYSKYVLHSELLKRRRGIYQQKLMVQPGAIVDDMSVHVAFAERQGFSYFAYAIPGSDLKRTSSSEEGQVGSANAVEEESWSVCL